MLLRLAAGCCCVVVLLAGFSPTAQEAIGTSTQAIDWPDDTVAVMRSFFERVDVEAVLDGVRAPRAVGSAARPELVAARLDASWQAPFLFVRGSIAYEPYAGAVRGPAGVLSAGSGNSLDQAVLLADLYRARGHSARLVRGRLRWQEAVRLVGESDVAGVGRGDAWLRWIEMAADHWWVEVRRNGGWVALDPSFPSSEVDQVHGQRRETFDRAPRDLMVDVTVEVLQGGVPQERISIPVTDLTWRPIRLQVHKELATAARSGVDLADAARGLGSSASTETGGTSPRPGSFDPLATVLPAVADGALVLDLAVGSRISPIVLGSREQLAAVELRVRIRMPLGGIQELLLPWPGGIDAQLLVTLGHGRVSADDLRTVSAPVYELLSRLAAAEAVALQAYEARSRTQGDDAVDGATGLAPATRSRRAPPLPLPGQPRVELDRPLHPSEELHAALVSGWLELEARGLPALSMAYMAAIDRLNPGARTVRAGVRAVGLGWRRPTRTSQGSLVVWSSDPVVIGGVDAQRRQGLQAAYGLLESALLGHVLNGFADQPPVTAFDVTLRGVGSGSRLGWWQPRDRLPDSWPARARVAAQRSLANGFTVIGPRSPAPRDGMTGLGWWALAPVSGSMTGVVAADSAVAQGAVALATTFDLRDLPSLLASVRDLHSAARWLIAAADPESGALAGLMPRACAATSLVGDLLIAGAPPTWQPPLFAGYCAGTRANP